MFGLIIIKKNNIDALKEELKYSKTVISEQEAKINELTYKLYLQTLELNEVNEELNEVNKERDTLIYNRRDNHGCLLRNKK